MNREDVISNLGTIARSGTREFLDKLQDKQNSQLIGQFGVGFYSAFIVADKISVETRRAGEKAAQGTCWQSTGDGEYTLESITKKHHGTDVILYLKEEDADFLDGFRLRSIIHKYSDHISIPVKMPQENTAKEEDDSQPAKLEWETINKATALWTQSKKDVSEKDYQEFYKHIAHDFEDPLSWSHNRVEGNLQYTSLLYIPSRAPFDLWNRDIPRGLKLYVQRVFIMDKAEQFLPLYLRFVKGIVDSNDLPLNVSREILQSNKTIEAMRNALTKRVLGMLEKLTDDKEQYAKFWTQFGQVIKEGPVEDFNNREQIAKLLRFASTESNNEVQETSLDDYIGRMQEGQDKIYYVVADNFNAAKHSPHLEIFRKQGIEVILLYDRIDEWLTGHLTEYQGKSLQSVAKGDLDLGELGEAPDEAQTQKQTDDFSSVISQMKSLLGDKVKDIRVTHRLTDSPVCIVSDDNDMSGHMQRILQAAGQEIPQAAPILELNPEHPLVLGLRDESDDARFEQWTQLLFDQAILAEGGSLDDPAEFVRRMNTFLLQTS